MLQRKILAVAKPHAEGDRAAGAAAALVDGFRAERRRRHPRRRLGVGTDRRRRRGTVMRTVEQKIEETRGARRARHGRK